MTPAPLSLRAFGHRLLVALLICVVVVVVMGVAVGRAEDAKVAKIRTVAIDPSLLRAGQQLPDHRLRHAFVREVGRRRRALRQRADAERATLRHDDGRAHRPREAHRRAGVVPARPVGRRSPVTARSKINAAFAFGGPRARDQDDRAGLRRPDQPLPRGRLRRLPRHRERDRQRADLLPGARRATQYTGLNVATPGCHDLNGDDALAYVRSRYYEYLKDGEWQYDPTSDLGRIQRQQYFIRSVASAAIHSVVTNPFKRQQGRRQERRRAEPRQGPVGLRPARAGVRVPQPGPHRVPDVHAARDQRLARRPERAAARRRQGGADARAAAGRVGPSSARSRRSRTSSVTVKVENGSGVGGAAGTRAGRARRRRVPRRRRRQRRRSLRLRR